MNKILVSQCQAICESDLPAISNISNILAILFHEYEDVNWAGLYFYDPKNNRCVLGPFQGNVACTRIPYGKGVVGTCAEKKETILVEDVHQFAGHIACDSASNSELVVPLIKDGILYAILDLDSVVTGYFNEDIKETVEEVSALLSDLVSTHKQWI